MAEAAAPAAGTLVDPYRAYNFKLEIAGVTEGHFTECSGLSARVGVIDYSEAGLARVVRRIPGRVEYGDVTLRYGLTASTQLWSWFQTALKGKVERRNISVLMLDEAGVTETIRWNLQNAWLSQWRAAPLEAASREVAIESLTLVFEALERDGQ